FAETQEEPVHVHWRPPLRGTLPAHNRGKRMQVVNGEVKDSRFQSVYRDCADIFAIRHDRAYESQIGGKRDADLRARLASLSRRPSLLVQIAVYIDQR